MLCTWLVQNKEETMIQSPDLKILHCFDIDSILKAGLFHFVFKLHT